jgi:hypothetical protein
MLQRVTRIYPIHPKDTPFTKDSNHRNSVRRYPG